MKKRVVSVMLVCSILTLSACGKKEEPVVLVPETVVSQENVESIKSEVEFSSEPVVESTMEETSSTYHEEETVSIELETESESVQTPEKSATMELLSLTEGEIAARKQMQANLATARDALYVLPNGKDKTEKIVQLDKQIIANNTYPFFSRRYCFIGDSITEGITASFDTDGSRISFPEYAADALHIGKMLNHGKGGRMFTDYGGEELSITYNFDNIINNSTDVFVVFAGVNDYLCTPSEKRFGNLADQDSTAGYCGTLRYFMKKLKNNMPDADVFFVLMYPISNEVTANYTDRTTQPTLNDFLEVQRKLCAEYGFHVIDLYKQGFMDCRSDESKNYYLRDSLHPKDNGNIALGTHIAAELSLYYSQKQ